MIVIRKLLKIIDGISQWTGRIAIWAVCLITGIVVYEVITRRFFHSPHVWTYEIITFFFGFHFMILAAYALLYRAHVAIDIVYNRLSPKRRAILDVVTYLVFFFPFLIILFKIGLENAAASWATKETTLTARLPIVMPAMKTITPVTAFLLLIQGFSMFYRRLYFLIKMEDPMALSLEERLIYDAGENLFFVNFEGYSVTSSADVQKIKSMVEKILSPLDKKVYTLVNYDNFIINPNVKDEYSEMVSYLVDKYYLGVARFAASDFLREELEETLKKRGLIPEFYETGEEARSALLKNIRERNSDA